MTETPDARRPDITTAKRRAKYRRYVLERLVEQEQLSFRHECMTSATSFCGPSES
jgi:hypothetical protein